jgi:hypothetical protein
VGTIAAVNASYALQGNKNLSELALANVEALAGEYEGGSCWLTYNYECLPPKTNYYGCAPCD